MNFRQYVRKNGGSNASYYTSFKDFPLRGDWRELKLFVNIHTVPSKVTTELECLHDDYLSMVNSARSLLSKIFKMVG